MWQITTPQIQIIVCFGYLRLTESSTQDPGPRSSLHDIRYYASQLHLSIRLHRSLDGSGVTLSPPGTLGCTDREVIVRFSTRLESTTPLTWLWSTRVTRREWNTKSTRYRSLRSWGESNSVAPLSQTAILRLHVLDHSAKPPFKFKLRLKELVS